MSTGKLLLYVIAGVVALVVASVVVSAVLSALAFLWFLARVLAFVALVGTIGYVGYKLYSLLAGGSRSAETTATGGEFSLSELGSGADPGAGDDIATGQSRADELRQQYVNGEITEAEFERRLERELDGGEYDSIDRELQRERI